MRRLRQVLERFAPSAGGSDVRALDRLFEAAELTIVDIGARGKGRAAFKHLASHAHLVACEPEAEEVDRLRSELREEGGWRDVTIVPDAIASREGEATLHVTRKPGMSSLLRPDPAVYKRYAATKPYAVQSRQAVRTVRLDTAAERHGFRDACFVKVDTQGTELDILRSGERLMRESVLGVYTEALFHPFYEGQSLFADLDAHLRGLGFVLFDLDRTLRRGSGHPTALYSRRQVVWAHCLYLREPGAVATQSPPDVRRLARYVSLALAHQHVDAALRVIEDEHAGPLLEERCGPGLAGAVGAYAGARTAQRLAGLSDEQAAAELSASAHDSRRG